MTDFDGEFPAGPFDVIYADPPWSYDNGDVPNGGVDEHYAVMRVEEIAALDVPVADDAVLYLWVTAPQAEAAFEVLHGWGFTYKTQAIWDKQQLGVGYWFRGEHELLYVGVRGDVHPPEPMARRSSIFRERRREHSRKPDVVRRYIEAAHPEARKIELFARDGFVGWELWGDETPDNKQTTVDHFHPTGTHDSDTDMRSPR